MKAEIKLEIDKEDLTYELKELVKELAETEIKKMIRELANEMVKEEIDKILHPLVLKVLTEDKFDFNSGYMSFSHKATLDEKLKNMTIAYLNRPSYLYSRDKRKPSERYSASSSGGENTALINHIVSDEIRLFVDTEFVPKVKEMIESLVTDKKKIEDILKEQTRQMVLDKLN
jgi:hypothetical protein